MNNSNSFQHCLHPKFTELLVKRLQDRTSINLVGKVEHGRSRILKDIQDCDLGEVKVVLADMKLYKHSYQGFIDEMNQQMGFDSDSANAPKDLTDWMNRVSSLQLKAYVLLDGFDALLSDKSIDELYRSNTFVSKINAMKNHSYLSLICATDEYHKASHFYIESKHVPSPFGLEKELMPTALSNAKIKAELERQLKNNAFWKNVKKRHNRGIFITAIQAHSKPYPFLVHLAKRIQIEDNIHANISQKIAEWKKEFEESERPHIDKTIIKGKQTVNRFWENIATQEPTEGKTSPSKSNSSKRPLWLSLFALAFIAAVYFGLQYNFWVSATSAVLAVTFFNQTFGIFNQIFKK